jgi:hypothetical protein
LNEFCTKVEESKVALEEKQKAKADADANNDNMPTTLLSPVPLASATHQVEEEEEDDEAGEEDYETYDDEDDEVLPQ